MECLFPVSLSLVTNALKQITPKLSGMKQPFYYAQWFLEFRNSDGAKWRQLDSTVSGSLADGWLDFWGLEYLEASSLTCLEADSGRQLEHLHMASPCDLSTRASLGFLTARCLPRVRQKHIAFLWSCLKRHSTTAIIFCWSRQSQRSESRGYKQPLPTLWKKSHSHVVRWAYGMWLNFASIFGKCSLPCRQTPDRRIPGTR